MLHSAATHQKFRSDWETGLAAAMAKVESLHGKGGVTRLKAASLVRSSNYSIINGEKEG